MGRVRSFPPREPLPFWGTGVALRPFAGNTPSCGGVAAVGNVRSAHPSHRFLRPAAQNLSPAGPSHLRGRGWPRIPPVGTPPQLGIDETSAKRHISALFYIKPQHGLERIVVVPVVFQSSSTSNHNSGIAKNGTEKLYFNHLLHQTTTLTRGYFIISLLYFNHLLHQTTTMELLICLYIGLYFNHLLHQTTTATRSVRMSVELYFNHLLHQTTTPTIRDRRCSELYFNHLLHQTTTRARCSPPHPPLYFNHLLHQTTTAGFFSMMMAALYFNHLLHQTTTL